MRHQMLDKFKHKNIKGQSPPAPHTHVKCISCLLVLQLVAWLHLCSLLCLYKHAPNNKWSHTTRAGPHGQVSNNDTIHTNGAHSRSGESSAWVQATRGALCEQSLHPWHTQQKGWFLLPPGLLTPRAFFGLSSKQLLRLLLKFSNTQLSN